MIKGFVVNDNSEKQTLNITMIDEAENIVPLSEATIEDRLQLIDLIGSAVHAIKVLLRMEHEGRSPDTCISGTCKMTKHKMEN